MRSIALALTTILAAGTATAATFERTPIAPEHGIEVFHRGTARRTVDRELFSDPYAGLVLARVDVYETFPYLETRFYQVVTDPGWDRLLVGEPDGGLRAFDGTGTSVGALSAPRGLCRGAGDRIYVCDTGNNRVIEFGTSGEFSNLTLEPVRVIPGLARPYDAAFSDGGTPDDPADDRLYVAETGRNRVVAFALGMDGVTQTGAVGELGSGPGFFAGPIAVAVGRDGAGELVYVADAHNRRVVRLRDAGDRLEWIDDAGHDLSVVTSLETDFHGNLYLTGPASREVMKLSPDLAPLGRSDFGLDHPRAFHPVLTEVRDHRTGNRSRSAEGTALVVEEWSDRSGFSLVRLGVEIGDLALDTGDGVEARFTLTDAAAVELVVRDAAGAPVARQEAGTLKAGAGAVRLDAALYAGLAAGEYLLEVAAISTYEHGGRAAARQGFLKGSGAPVTGPALLGSNPNPFHGSTRVGFLAPAGGAPVRLEVFDLNGRRIRTLFEGEAAGGRGEVSWDGRDDAGRNTAAGVYLFRLQVDGRSFTAKTVRVQ